MSVVGIYEGPADAECPAIAEEYTQRVTLDLEGLEAGTYTVRAGDKSATFILPSAERRTVEATIENVDVVLRESDPVQVVVYVNSYYSGCTTFSSVSQRRDMDTFFITVLVSAPILPGEPTCPPTEYPFTEQVVLETTGLDAGDYVVSVNGVQKTFTLP